jgi:alkylation response protein AidB-like acyl-CoA dehydrogenase
MAIVNRADLDFMLYDWLGAESLCDLPRFADQSRADYDAFLDLGEKLAEREFLPCHKAGDQQEPQLGADGSVALEPGTRAAVRTYLENGLQLATVDEAHGGMQFPMLIASGVMANLMGANIAASGFAMLSIANARVISDFGTPEQIALFATPQHEGETLGTMCLSEPDVGSSVGDITTRAVGDETDAIGARFRLSGRKMWISAAEQDATDNIVHLVLAKIANEDGSLPAGAKGISLFIVPKILPDALGVPGARNDLEVVGLNHKMGYRATPNCLLNFGEGKHMPLGEKGAIGYLLGAPGQGLAIMFQMMNEARINVGLGAAALAYRGYTLSRDYALERLQGRPLEDKKIPNQVPISRHPDVRRMVLGQKAIAEGALALCLYSAKLSDLTQGEQDEAARIKAQALLDILTPITKSWPSEQGLIANHMAIQIHGGYGYTRDFDVEQIYRDNRLNPIHEGTTGIQGIDLLGRKILFDRNGSLGVLLAEIRQTIAKAKGGSFEGYAGVLEVAVLQIETLVAGIDDAPKALAHGTAFLSAFGHMVLGWIWLDMAMAAQKAGAELAEGKALACAYFYAYEMPQIAGWLAPMEAGTTLLSDLNETLL